MQYSFFRPRYTNKSVTIILNARANFNNNPKSISNLKPNFKLSSQLSQILKHQTNRNGILTSSRLIKRRRLINQDGEK